MLRNGNKNDTRNAIANRFKTTIKSTSSKPTVNGQKYELRPAQLGGCQGLAQSNRTETNETHNRPSGELWTEKPIVGWYCFSDSYVTLPTAHPRKPTCQSETRKRQRNRSEANKRTKAHQTKTSASDEHRKQREKKHQGYKRNPKDKTLISWTRFGLTTKTKRQTSKQALKHSLWQRRAPFKNSSGTAEKLINNTPGGTINGVMADNKPKERARVLCLCEKMYTQEQWNRQRRQKQTEHLIDSGASYGQKQTTKGYKRNTKPTKDKHQDTAADSQRTTKQEASTDTSKHKLWATKRRVPQQT